MGALNKLIHKVGIGSKAKEEKKYALQLICTLESDLKIAYEDLDRFKNELEVTFEKSKKYDVDDKYLLKKCEEHFEKIEKSLKKGKKRKQKQTKTIKDMYDSYSVIMELMSTKTITKEYINQLNRYIGN